MRRENPDRLLRDIGRRIAELRADRGWSQEAFAERLGVNRRYVARLESGAQNFTVHRLWWLADHLDVHTAEPFVTPRDRGVRRGRPKNTAMSRVPESKPHRSQRDPEYRMITLPAADLDRLRRCRAAIGLRRLCLEVAAKGTMQRMLRGQPARALLVARAMAYVDAWERHGSPRLRTR